MARSTKPARGDRPLEPQVPADVEVVRLDDVTTGEWDGVALTGSLPPDFDEPLILRQVRLERATLLGARLRGSRFVDVTIDGCDLSGADLGEASLTKVAVSDSRLAALQLPQSRLRDVRFVDCRLDDVNLAMTTGERVRFERCRMERADLRSARLEGVAWWDCDLRSADFSQVQIERGQLQGSALDDVHGATALSSVTIDAEQFPSLAEHLLAVRGIVVRERDQS
jgi:uncharacterized protein YjbI with pentapeptide repeats